MRGKGRSALINAGLIFLFLNVTACGSISKHISESDIPHDQWPIEIYQPDKDLSFIGSQLSQASPGLLTAVIDGARDGNAEDAYAPLLEFAENGNLNDLFLARIRESNILRLLSRNGEIIASANFDSSNVDDGFINVSPVIELTHDLSTLLVRLEYKEYTPGAIGFTMNGFYQKYYYVYRLDDFDENKSRSEFAEQWVEIGEDRFVEIVETGIDETIKMMKTYLANPNPTLNSEQKYYVQGYRLMSSRSYIWGGDEDVTWLIREYPHAFAFATPKEFIQEAD